MPYEQFLDIKAQNDKNIQLKLGGSSFFWASKRVLDILLAVSLLPCLAIISLILFALNPIWNNGPVFFIQSHMGKNCQKISIIKFRTMIVAETIERGPEEPIEKHRVTKLGNVLRKFRIDELPQMLNVLKGDMSFLGPRPDYYPHAEYFIKIVPGYRERHMVRPGISGLAQVVIPPIFKGTHK